MKKAMRRASLFLAISMLTGLFTAPPATAAAAAHCGAFEYVTLHVLKIDVTSMPKSVAIGDTAKIDLHVTRTYEDDPAATGLPVGAPYSEPAADVQVGIGMRVGDVFLFGFARTDANGDASVEIPIKRYVKPDWAFIDVFAQKIVQETQCLTLQEIGYGSVPKAFKVTR
jgi:hypothetical protein